MTASAQPAKASIPAAPAHETAGVRLLANAIRALAMDAVEAAKSGHPGMPMGMADAATVLFTRFLKFDPAEPNWPDRDRFVLSAGHGSMLLYALLYLCGYEHPTIEDIRRFRQLGSPCAGHPEYGHLPGVETTTGPLGQGFANAVGMAIAERHLNARFGDALVDHRTYVIASDGDLMEGVSHEAAALAGHLKLGRLIVLFDDNGITIDGSTALSESTDVTRRFDAYGWNTMRADGLDGESVAAALAKAQTSDKPTLIACKTIIGFGAPNRAGNAKAHGEALGPDEVAGARKSLGWHHEPFHIPDEIVSEWRTFGARGRDARKKWEDRRKAAKTRDAFDRAIAGDVSREAAAVLNALKQKVSTEKPNVATRKASEMALAAINPVVPETVGGSADLTGSNLTLTKDLGVMAAANYGGRFIHYGVREHGMAAAMNGMALHGGIIPYSGTFLVFSDYARPSIRLAALMGLRVIHVMTHDSIGLGEDGPTHQPIEHLASLRAIPNLLVLRPADAVETAECWQIALERKDGPSLLALTRQGVATLRTEHTDENKSAKGAYVLADTDKAQVTLIATGSEVEIAMKARDILGTQQIAARVVSMPSWELFAAQPEDYRRAVIAPGTAKVAVEAGSWQGWGRWTGADGALVGMHGFGASAPYKELYKHFGITAEAAAEAAVRLIKGRK